MKSKVNHGPAGSREAKFTLQSIEIETITHSRPAEAHYRASYMLEFEGNTWPLTVVGTFIPAANGDRPRLIDFEKTYQNSVRHHHVRDLLAQQDMDLERFRSRLENNISYNADCRFKNTPESEFSKSFTVYERFYLDHPAKLVTPVQFEIQAVDKQTGDYEVVELINAPSRTYISNALVERLQNARLHAELCHVSPTRNKWEMSYRVVANNAGIFFDMRRNLNEWSDLSERGHTLQIGWGCDIFDDDDIVGGEHGRAEEDAALIMEVTRLEREEKQSTSFCP